MKKTKIIGFAASVLIAVSSIGGITSAAESANAGEMRDITTMELVRDMGIGINLGNTLESCGDWIAEYGDGTVGSYERAWGSPDITQEIIQGYADEGFGVLRIPVAWSNMMQANYKISSEYMSRVQQIVDWAIDAGMYAIINIHYDNGWVNNFPENKEQSMNRFETMWSQICEGFKSYDDHLMFESQNEELGWQSLWNPWGGTEGKAESFQLVNEINQKFVDVVRSSGGNNPERHLLISGYNTSIDHTCDPLFEMPYDPANRCAISVHYYSPADFAILEEDADWAKMRPTWGTDQDFADLNQQMDLMKTTYIDKGIPVIIGEYGCPKKNKDADSVKLFLASVCKTAFERHLCPIMWDITDLHYDRRSCKMIDQDLKESLNEIASSGNDLIAGDINDDGKVNSADAVQLRNYLLDSSIFTEKQIIAADLNNDNSVDSFDMVFMRRILINQK